MQFVEWLNTNRRPLHPKPILIETVKDEVDVQLALQYDAGYQENTLTFVNNINTHEGGTHLSGFRSALTRTVNAYATRSNLAKDLKDATISGDDIREGMTAVISVKIPDRKSTRLNSSHIQKSRMPSSA